jgi:signal transduction histidine kinase
MSLQLLENNKVGELNEEQKKLIDGIKDDTARLLKITGELLNMTQVESGSIQLSVLPCDPKEIIDYAIGANKVAADQKSITFDLMMDNSLPQVLADSEKTSWVLTNLLSNAIRYSYENSSISIDIKRAEGNRLIFSVKDSGQGIEPQYLDKIFNRYFKIPGAKKEGTGLGLNISKEFMEAQAGTLFVKSKFGFGSTFSISLPTL